MSAPGKITSGQLAPEFCAEDLNGEAFRLSEHLEPGGAALFFLRFAGCPLTGLYLADLLAAYSRFREAGVTVTAVIASPGADIKRLPWKSFPFFVIPDRDANLHRTWGMGRAGAGEIFHVDAAAITLRAFINGHTARLMAGDLRQLPGAFLIDNRGRVVLSHTGRNIADMPAPEKLLRAALTGE